MTYQVSLGVFFLQSTHLHFVHIFSSDSKGH